MNLDLARIGGFIQICRKDLGLTQAEVGERLCVSPQSVSNWERGASLPDVALLPDLACMLRCSVDAILSGGNGCGGYRRHVTVAQMREALSAIDRIGELLGREHFVYRSIIDALNTRMNTSRPLARTVGITSGRITPVTRCKLLAPRLSAASFRELSKFSRAPQTYI